MIQNEIAVDALKRIATLSDQEQEMYNALRKNEKFDMEELNESASYSAEENAAIRAYKETQTALNEARVDFFTEKLNLLQRNLRTWWSALFCFRRYGDRYTNIQRKHKD